MSTNSGARVMGLVSAGAVRSIVKPDVDLMWQVPNDWSLEDAATVPLPYVHAYYCLILKGQVKKKETVFVTNGTEALGQAVISICVSLGINIFTSVSDEAQKQFLLKHLPGLNGQHVICCKHERFLDKVKEITKNSRFNIVINSTNGYFREAAMEYVAFSGQFIDVSETDMRENKNFGMLYLREARTYRPALRQLVANGIVTGAVRPLSRVVFSPPDISRSFQLLASKGVRERILVNMEKLTTLPFSSNVFSSLSFTEGTHIVVCDTGSLGIHLIENLVLKGAKNIVVHMKSNNEYLLHKLICWKKNYINLKINSENLQTREGCNKLINTGKENGSIRSIFIVHDFKQKVNSHNPENDFKLCFMETYIVTANLDAISRNINSLSNFVLISICSQSLNSEYAISACNKIFEDRRNIGLPGLIIRTMVSNKFIENSNNWLPSIDLLSTLFHTMDTSIKMNYGNVLIYNSDIKKSNTKTRTLQQILGLSDLDNISNLTLEEMNVSDFQIEEIRLHLMPIRYSVEEIKKLTLLRIEELWKTVTKGSISLSRGLAVFYNYVDRNEYNALDLVVPMKTLLPYYEEHIYMDRYKSHLIMIPGFDGHNHNLVSLAERLKIPTATLQLGPDIIHDSIPNMATYLANHIKLNFHLSNFYLLGYSFGVLVALEVAKILESDGLIGVVYCLDSSPDALKSQLTAYLGNLNDGQLQNIILEHMYYLMTGRKSMELKQDLLSHCTENWSTKVNICMRHLKGIVNYSNDFQKCVLESAYNRIKLAKTYECDFKLKSELILIKGILNPKMEGLNEDYNLSKYTESPVRVFPIESDHASALYNNNVPHIVNKRLDPCVLQDFKRANLCEFYYME